MRIKIGFILFFFYCFCVVVHGQMGAKKNVVHLNSYDVDYEWAMAVAQGINMYFNGKDSFVVSNEFLDSKKFHPENIEKWFVPYVQEKYKNIKIDILICSDNSALDFYVKYHQLPVFKNALCVFCGVSNPEDYPLEKLDLYGVKEQNMFNASFEMIRKIYPNLENIIAFSDKTITGQIYKRQALKYLSDYPECTFNMIDTVTRTNLDAILEEINKIPNSVIYYYGVNIYADNEPADDFFVINEIIKKANIPVFTGYVDDVKGITGRYYAQGTEHGLKVAELAESRIKGLTIPKRILDGPYASLFDFTKMVKYNLDPNKVPEESIFVNKPVSAWYRYRAIIIWNGVFIAFLIFIIILLVRYNNIQKRGKHYMQIARDKALQSDVLKSAFLANVSHELRTPLNAISGFAEIALTSDSEGELQEYLTIIYENTELLAQLVNDILDLSLIDANELKIIKKPFDLIKLFNSLSRRISPILKLKNKEHLNIEILVNEDYQVINGDELRIGQVMTNFLSNAIKFTNEGHISFGFDHISKFTKVSGEFPEYSDALLLYVRDTGIGIDEVKQKDVFDRFSRIDSKYVNQHGGVGLGLNISKSLAELMNGEIWLESEVGKGSTFGLILPLDSN